MVIALLSDIHANLTALQAIMETLKSFSVDKYVLLGDVVNYGMRPNEVIGMLSAMSDNVLVNLWGNHEKAVADNDVSRFSTDRGKQILHYTQGKLSLSSLNYINTQMNHSGFEMVEIAGKRILAVHGTLKDPFWGKFTTEEFGLEAYAQFDFVFSGHSHIRHFYEMFYPCDNSNTRNKKRTTFINPGSVGQPRNINPFAQCGILDIENNAYTALSLPYDISKEQILFTNEIDGFYRDRLSLGV